MSLNSKVRDITNLNIGYNGRATEGPSWEDNTFVELVADMNPDVVRYPAGTQANYWDWHTGTFIEGCGKTADYIYTIEMLVNGLPDSTQIVYVANMARPTPATGIALDASDEVLESDETLQKKIDDIKGALALFKDFGKLPFAIELGNEFYFDNEHGAFYASNPDLYMNHAKQISISIKAIYPDIKIVLCTTKGGSTRRDYWNNTIFDYLKIDTEFASIVYSVVQHHYINETYGDETIVFDNESAKIAMTEGFQYTREHIADYELVPDNIPIWLTEYGATKLNAEGTWTAGMRAVAMSLGWLDMGDQIEQLLFHHLTSKPNVINDDITLAPIGMSMKLLTNAAKEKTSMQKILFDNNPIATNSIGSLHGYRFKNDSIETSIIINLSETQFTDMDISSLFSYDGTANLTQYWSENPYESPVYENFNISTENTEIDNVYTIQPFSVSVIDVNNDGTSTYSPEISKPNIKVYPTSFNNVITVEIFDKLINTNIQILNLTGSTVYKNSISNNTSYHNPKLQPGTYIITIKNNNKTSSHIIVKN